jgi:hypothetical protein
MWYEEQLQAQGYLVWNKDDLQEFGSLHEGMEFTLHGAKWRIIDMMWFRGTTCKIARI